jgi:hypothetical protein
MVHKLHKSPCRSRSHFSITLHSFPCSSVIKSSQIQYQKKILLPHQLWNLLLKRYLTKFVMPSVSSRTPTARQKSTYNRHQKEMGVLEIDHFLAHLFQPNGLEFTGRRLTLNHNYIVYTAVPCTTTCCVA